MSAVRWVQEDGGSNAAIRGPFNEGSRERADAQQNTIRIALSITLELCLRNSDVGNLVFEMYTHIEMRELGFSTH